MLQMKTTMYDLSWIFRIPQYIQDKNLGKSHKIFALEFLKMGSPHLTITRRKTRRKRWWWPETIQFTNQILAHGLRSIALKLNVWPHTRQRIRNLVLKCSKDIFASFRNETIQFMNQILYSYTCGPTVWNYPESHSKLRNKTHQLLWVKIGL